jgi:hypothetical protein
MKLEFSRQTFENAQISNLKEIRPVRGELFHADGQTEGRVDRQTDRTKLTVALRNFVSGVKRLIKGLKEDAGLEKRMIIKWIFINRV